MRTSELSEPLLLNPGETRGAAPLRVMGDKIWVKLSGADTAGKYAMMEDVTEPQSGPPLHRHNREDESFYILEGNFLFEIDGKRLPAGPGSSVFVPRGTPHAYRNIGDTAGKMLIMVQPAGLDDFLAEISDPMAGQREPDMSVIIPIARKYGLELLGLPIAD